MFDDRFDLPVFYQQLDVRLPARRTNGDQLQRDVAGGRIQQVVSPDERSDGEDIAAGRIGRPVVGQIPGDSSG